MKKIFTLIFIVLFSIGITYSEKKDKRSNNLQKPTVNFAVKVKQGFNMKVWLSNQMTMGTQAWDGGSESTPDGFGLEYPAGSGVEHLYGAGPRIGGIIDGTIHVSEGYEGSLPKKEFLPERAHLPRERFWQTSIRDTNWKNPYTDRYETIPNKRGCDDDNDGAIDEDDLDGIDNDGDWNPLTDDVGYDGLADPFELSCNGKPYDPEANPDPFGDNYDPGVRDRCHPTESGEFPWKRNKDIWTEKNGMPDHGEPNVDEDYAAISENDYYCSATDTFRTPTVAGHFPMYIKVIQKSYAWDNKSAEGILPFDYYFINLGKYSIKRVYVGFFADCDLGPINIDRYYENNYTAYMESLRTAYTHNPVNRGSTPIGFTVLATPKPLDEIDFVWNWADWATPGHIDPRTNDSLIYTWMDGSAFPNKIGPNQSPDQLSDTRFYFSFGPFETLEPGDTLRISMALVAGDAVSAGPNNLKENAEDAMKLYTRGYVTPIVPISPMLKLDTLPDPARGIRLTWFPHLDYRGNPTGPFTVWDDSNKIAQGFPPDHWRRVAPPCGEGSSACSGHKCEGDSLPGGRIFSGFRLYRSEDIGVNPQQSSFTLIKEYSIPDSARLWSIEELVAKYLDSTFVDSPLVRGKKYWYSVTAFGLPDITIIPVQQPDNSVRYDTLYSSNSESDFSQNRVSIDLPFAPSTENGKVLVVPNPYRVNEEYTYENGGWEGVAKFWDESKRKIKLIHLPTGEWTVRIFSLVGDLITTIKNTQASGYTRGDQYIEEYRPDRGEINWDLLSESYRALASGVYVFSVESSFGTQIGKFVLIR
ncbi:MAG: hypothetical protein HZB59_01840 [Ignavibacteriales bacterium]|nr:hypothetical protein [Ignavibacteriales bacterium]